MTFAFRVSRTPCTLARSYLTFRILDDVGDAVPGWTVRHYFMLEDEDAVSVSELLDTRKMYAAFRQLV